MSEFTLPPHILVVDDDVAVRNMLEQALSGRGFVVSAAANGLEALEVLRHHRPAAAVLDVLMPGMDGPTTLRALRAVQPELPACFFTGHAGGYAEAELLAQGACAVLNKPCPLDKLAETLIRLIESGGS
jgi:CheY-like chemotaxis protein